MPKSMLVNPKDQFKNRTIKFQDIKVCEYNKTVADEKGNFTKEDFLGMYADMVAIREFEEMLLALKKKGEYNERKFTYPGPSHLALGEEATAVGQAYELGVNDFIFGTHRSHHEVIAKAMSAIKKLSDKELRERINRMNLEKQFDQLMDEDYDRGHITADDILETVGSVVQIGGSIATMIAVAALIKK